MQPEKPVDRSRIPAAVIALIVLAIAVLGVALWRSAEIFESAAAAETAATAPAAPAMAEGFRSDAWFLPDDDKLGFVAIAAGTFLMGSDPAVDPMAFDNERWSAESAQGTLEVPTFYIGRYEVTVGQYAAFVDATGHAVADPQALNAPPDYPVGSVSWTDALAYARWLEKTLRESSLTPLAIAQLLRDGWHVTLPTEAQWEKAARGADGRIYPWGNSAPIPEVANFGGRGVRPVGSYDCAECANGLADMSGNVWELTRSPYQPLPYDTADDRDDLESDALWVMRGGGYDDGPQNIRTAIRGGVDPGARRPNIGFRLVLTRE